MQVSNKRKCQIMTQITSQTFSGGSKHFENGAEDNVSAPSSFIANAHNYAFLREKAAYWTKSESPPLGPLPFEPIAAETTSSRDRTGWKDESSDDCRKLAGTVQTRVGNESILLTQSNPIHGWIQSMSNSGADVTWRDSSFQTRAAATGKPRLPTVDNGVQRTTSQCILQNFEFGVLYLGVNMY